jgi:hypothetical protein
MLDLNQPAGVNRPSRPVLFEGSPEPWVFLLTDMFLVSRIAEKSEESPPVHDANRNEQH